MNTHTGEVVPYEALQSMPADERAKFVEIKRDLTKLEEASRQIKLYAPCGCGSGKKFKFCCKKN